MPAELTDFHPTLGIQSVVWLSVLAFPLKNFLILTFIWELGHELVLAQWAQGTVLGHVRGVLQMELDFESWL